MIYLTLLPQRVACVCCSVSIGLGMQMLWFCAIHGQPQDGLGRWFGLASPRLVLEEAEKGPQGSQYFHTGDDL